MFYKISLKQNKSYKIISNDEKKPSTANVGGFFRGKENQVETFCCRTKSETITYIMCKRG